MVQTEKKLKVFRKEGPEVNHTGIQISRTLRGLERDHCPNHKKKPYLKKSIFLLLHIRNLHYISFKMRLLKRFFDSKKNIFHFTKRHFSQFDEKEIGFFLVIRADQAKAVLLSK
jgi:hypothetical protein